MKKTKQSMNGKLLLYSFLSLILVIFITTTNTQLYADIWDDDDTMEELVKDIDTGNDNDDDMDWDEFKDSKIFK